MGAHAAGYQRIELRAPAAVEGIVHVTQYLLDIGALGRGLDLGVERESVHVGQEARHIAAHPVHLGPSQHCRSVGRVVFKGPFIAFHGQGVLIFREIFVALDGEGIGAGVAPRMLLQQFQIKGGAFLPASLGRVHCSQGVFIPVVGGIQGCGGLEVLFGPGGVAGRPVGHSQLVLHGIVGRIVSVQVLKLAYSILRCRLQLGHGVDEDVLGNDFLGRLGPQGQDGGKQNYGEDGFSHGSTAQCKINAFSLSL